MKAKILNTALVITSLFGYLEWGGNQSSFLWQAEVEILAKLFSDPLSVAHPFILMPLAGQLLLLFSLFQPDPGRAVTFTGIGLTGILLLFMFLIGVMSLNMKIIISTLPFLALAIITIRARK